MPMEEYVEIPLIEEAEPETIDFGERNGFLHWVYNYPNGYSASIILQDHGFWSVSAFPTGKKMVSHIFMENHGPSEDYLRFDQVAELLIEISTYPSARW